MKKAFLMVFMVILAVLSACTPATVPDEPITNTPATPSEPIPPSPEHSPPGEHGEELLVRGNSAFAFELYQKLKEEEGNLFLSPYSISMALAMTYAGARGETAEQMAAALNFDFGLPDERLRSAFNTLGEELAERGKGREMMMVQPE